MPNLRFYFHIYIYVAGENNLTHRVGEILGFGVTTEGDTMMPCALQGAYIEIFTADECMLSKLPSQVPNPRILCAGVIGGGVDSCKVRTNAELRYCMVQGLSSKENNIILLLRKWNRNSECPPLGTFLALLNPISQTHFCENFYQRTVTDKRPTLLTK
jgi:hypothetical protein